MLSWTRVYESRPPGCRSGTGTAAAAGGSDTSLPSSTFLPPPPALATVTPKSDMGAVTTVAPSRPADDSPPLMRARVAVMVPKSPPVPLQSLNDGNDPTSSNFFVVAAGPHVDGRHPGEIGLVLVCLITSPRLDCALIMAGAVSGFLVERGGSDGVQTGAFRSRSSLVSTE